MRHPGRVIKLASTGANLWPDSTAFATSVWKNGQMEFAAGQNKTNRTTEEKNSRKIFLLDWSQPHIALKALRTIQCPSLIICGDHDVIALNHTVLIYQNIPKAYLWILPNSSHSTLIDHAGEFNNKVDEF